MNSVKRRINSTGRKKIDRSSVAIVMAATKEGEPLSAKVSVHLDSEKFPSDAHVFLEAYHRSSRMRFDLGTFGSMKKSIHVVLDQIDRGVFPLFRLKVVNAADEPGKILGAAIGIQPSSGDDQEDKRSLFPVDYCDLGEEVWKVQIGDGNRPRLLLSNRVQNMSLKLRDNPLFKGLVLPAALRRVMEELAFKSDSEDEDETGWREEWFHYCKESLNIDTDPSTLDEDGKSGWVDEVVGKFCGNYQFVQNVKKMETEATRS